MTVYIGDLNKAEVLFALYCSSQVQGNGFLAARKELSLDACREIVAPWWVVSTKEDLQDKLVTLAASGSNLADFGPGGESHEPRIDRSQRRTREPSVRPQGHGQPIPQSGRIAGGDGHEPPWSRPRWRSPSSGVSRNETCSAT